MSGVLVINAGHEQMHRVSLQHALGMLRRNVAVVEVQVGDKMIGPWPLPAVLRLLRYVKRWKLKGRPSWSRTRLLERDNYRCAYCGGTASTVDHVKPRKRGGVSEWLNTVAACEPCNFKKGSLTLAQAGMRLRWDPFVPEWSDIEDPRVVVFWTG
jgi:hypothetical protein